MEDDLACRDNSSKVTNETINCSKTNEDQILYMYIDVLKKVIDTIQNVKSLTAHSKKVCC